MSSTCRRCGLPLVDGRCSPCWQKDVKGSMPGFVLPDGVEVDHIQLDQEPGRPYPQPLTVEQAVSGGWLYVEKQGHGMAYYPLTRRVKIHVRPIKEK
jgi:hypothetical protein